MTDHPSARFQGRVAALNRSRDRLDAARDRLVSLDVFGYRIAPGGVPGAFNVHDRHGRHVGRFMPDGRFQRSSVTASTSSRRGLPSRYGCWQPRWMIPALTMCRLSRSAADPCCAASPMAIGRGGRRSAIEPFGELSRRGSASGGWRCLWADAGAVRQIYAGEQRKRGLDPHCPSRSPIGRETVADQSLTTDISEKHLEGWKPT